MAVVVAGDAAAGDTAGSPYASATASFTRFESGSMCGAGTKFDWLFGSESASGRGCKVTDGAMEPSCADCHAMSAMLLSSGRLAGRFRSGRSSMTGRYPTSYALYCCCNSLSGKFVIVVKDDSVEGGKCVVSKGNVRKGVKYHFFSFFDCLWCFLQVFLFSLFALFCCLLLALSEDCPSLADPPSAQVVVGIVLLVRCLASVEEDKVGNRRQGGQFAEPFVWQDFLMFVLIAVHEELEVFGRAFLVLDVERWCVMLVWHIRHDTVLSFAFYDFIVG